MHAVVASVNVWDVDAAREALAEMRLTLVPKAPGFVAAYWLEPIDSIGMSVILFETEDDAHKAMSYPLPPLPGITPRSVEIREVYANT